MGVTFINLARLRSPAASGGDGAKDRELLQIQDQSTLWSKKAF